LGASQLRPSWPPRGTPARAACSRQWWTRPPPLFRHCRQIGQFVHGVDQRLLQRSSANRAHPVLRASARFGDGLEGRRDGFPDPTPSMASSLAYCLTSAFLGSVRICTSASSREFGQGGHHRHTAHQFGNQAELDQVLRLHVLEDLGQAALRLALDTLAPKPMPEDWVRLSMTFSRPENAPPQMNKMLVVSICTKS
jgi:hypothetical protein